jgi:microcystin-dependent protein
MYRNWRHSALRSVMKQLLAGSVLFSVAGVTHPAMADVPHLAQRIVIAAPSCPKGFAPLAGQSLPINQNQALFSVLGTRYGGDGRTVFSLPRAKPIFAANASGDQVELLQCIALQGIFPSPPQP